MKWKLWTRNENIMPATTESEQHDSKDAALERACDIIRHQRHVAVLYIEGADGERIEAADISWRGVKRGRPWVLSKGGPGSGVVMPLRDPASGQAIRRLVELGLKVKK